MAGFDLNSFKASFDGGARAYLFMWQPDLPVQNTLGEGTSYLVKASSLPGDTVEEIVVTWQGADYKMAGRRTFDAWNVSLNIDRNSAIRRDLDAWMKAIHKIDTTNDYAYGVPGAEQSPTGDVGSYFSQQTMQLLDYNGEVITAVTLYGAWPSAITETSLDYQSMEVATFDVTFTYQYHEFSDGEA
jgi:hypothetical protein